MEFENMPGPPLITPPEQLEYGGAPVWRDWALQIAPVVAVHLSILGGEARRASKSGRESTFRVDSNTVRLQQPR